MKNNLTLLLIILFCGCLLSIGGCSKTYDKQTYMCFDNVHYVDSFPKTFSPHGKIVETDAIGMRNFLIYDSIMIMSTNSSSGFWVIASLPDLRTKGSALQGGRGPLEVTYPPSVTYNTTITTENGQTIGYIYDSPKRKLYKLNITQSLTDRVTRISSHFDSLPNNLFNLVVINDSLILCKAIRNQQTQQIRFLYDRTRKEIHLPLLDVLNKAAIREGEDYNILSTITKYNPCNGVFVEMPIGLNYINMYSLDSTIIKTICIGKTIDNIERIQDIGRWSRIYTFADVRLYKDFWGVLFIDDTEKNFQTKRKKLPRILFFDWAGNALCDVQIDHFATSFDFDFHRGHLYTLDSETETFVRYDFPTDRIINNLNP